MVGNDVVQSLWIGESLSVLERLCLTSFLRSGHQFYLFTYGPVEGIPAGVIELDANEIIPESQIFRDSSGGVAAFSDWFRFQLLFDRGGWWVDADTLCLRPFDIVEDFCFSSEKQPRTEVAISTCCIKAPAGSEVFTYCLDYIHAHGFADVAWGAYGPELFSEAVIALGLEEHVRSPEVFCPVHWWEMDRLVALNDGFALGDSTLAIHLWNEIWRVGGLRKDATYHPDSLYEQMKVKFGFGALSEVELA